MVTLADVRDAAARIAGRVIRTPSIESDAVSRATGARVTLKLDNLQAVGAFKERGAANRLALLSPAERAAGVIAMSAGNHAQAVARHAHLLGVAATIVMPSYTPSSKVTRTAAWGAHVVMRGESLAEAGAHAYALAEAEGLVFIHPYDDEGVMGLFATHPPVAKRIAALSQYAVGRITEPKPATPPAKPAQPSASTQESGPWGGRKDEPSGPWS